MFPDRQCEKSLAVCFMARSLHYMTVDVLALPLLLCCGQNFSQFRIHVPAFCSPLSANLLLFLRNWITKFVRIMPKESIDRCSPWRACSRLSLPLFFPQVGYFAFLFPKLQGPFFCFSDLFPEPSQPSCLTSTTSVTF